MIQKKGQQSCTQNECMIVGHYEKKLCQVQICARSCAHLASCQRLLCWHCWCCPLGRHSRCHSCWRPLCVRCTGVCCAGACHASVCRAGIFVCAGACHALCWRSGVAFIVLVSIVGEGLSHRCGVCPIGIRCVLHWTLCPEKGICQSISCSIRKK